MTVKEAIKQLAEFPQDYELYLHKDSDCKITDFYVDTSDSYIIVENDCYCGYS